MNRVVIQCATRHRTRARTEFTPHFRRRLSAGAHAELLEDVVNVVLHRGDLDEELRRNLFVAQATVDQTKNLTLAPGDVRGAGDISVAREIRHAAEKGRGQFWR